MPEAEKAERHGRLHKIVTTHTSHSWAAVLVKMLLTQIGGQTTARQTPYIPRDILEAKYKGARKRLFLFDYDVGFPFFKFLPSRHTKGHSLCRVHLRLSSRRLAWPSPAPPRSKR